ncbi:SusD/RagB family nutrient-binding outer membrane lipoprotein [Sediminicola luteus]|uniref:SusD/RagB family nutrient-binding outer membrane lipoprotein n=1 Tax=Sediminicola luteus TaxID=319238 RepID=A0A2A4G7A3_9FLAO|nr:SusD/RagB family nutrient-binding outer membrane lipoprotein [Sediminicola luteus]PCE63632.1 hypothetical protein B7P33_10125 [Sediminicola luteus]
MKKSYIRIFLSACVLGATLVSCEEGFEEMNQHPEKPTQTVPDHLYTGILDKLNYRGNACLYTYLPQTSIAVRHSTSTPLQNLDLLENRSGIDDLWKLYYEKLRDMNRLKEEMDKSAYLPEQHRNQKAMLEILEAQFALMVADAFGDMPYTEAGQGLSDDVYRPVYDSQADVYKMALDKVKAAVASLALTTETPDGDAYLDFNSNKLLTGSSDALTNFTFFKKFGNAMLIKHGLRLSKLDATAAQDYISTGMAGPLMEASTENAGFTNERARGSGDWSWARYYGPTYQPSEFLADQMVDDAADMSNIMDAEVYDPRFYAVFYPNKDGEFRILPNSPDAVAAESPYLAQAGLYPGGSNGNLPEAPGYAEYEATHSIWNRFYISSNEMPYIMISYAEQQLIIAEAIASGYATGDAQMYYESGVRASVEEFLNLEHAQNPDANPDRIITLEAADIDAMLAHPEVAYNAASALDLIRTQRWIDYINRPNEAWAMMRRTNHFNVDNDVPITNNGDAFSMVYRLMYPANEADYNTDNYVQQLSKMGGTDNVRYVPDIFK